MSVMAFKDRSQFAAAQKAMEAYEWQKADQLFSELLAGNRDHAEALLHRAFTRMRLQKWDDAVKDIDAGIVLRPENGIYWMIKGEILSAKAEWLGAYEALKKAVELEPDNARALYFMGRCLQHLGRQLDAAEFMERALHFDRDFVTAQSLVAGV